MADRSTIRKSVVLTLVVARRGFRRSCAATRNAAPLADRHGSLDRPGCRRRDGDDREHEGTPANTAEVSRLDAVEQRPRCSPAKKYAAETRAPCRRRRGRARGGAPCRRFAHPERRAPFESRSRACVRAPNTRRARRLLRPRAATQRPRTPHQQHVRPLPRDESPTTSFIAATSVTGTAVLRWISSRIAAATPSGSVFVRTIQANESPANRVLSHVSVTPRTARTRFGARAPTGPGERFRRRRSLRARARRDYHRYGSSARSALRRSATIGQRARGS